MRIKFPWERNAAGYDWADVPPDLFTDETSDRKFPRWSDPALVSDLVIGGFGFGGRRAGGKYLLPRKTGEPPQVIYPLELDTGLFRNFSEVVPIPEEIRNFADKYGQLYRHVSSFYKGSGSGRERDSVNVTRLETWQDEIGRMRTAVDAWQRVRNRIGDVWQRGADVRYVTDTVAHINAALTFTIEQAGLGFESELVATPLSLTDAMWYQYATAVSNNSEMKRCAECNIWFAFGRGTGRRRNAEFCSDRCRGIAHQKRHREN